MLSPSEIERLIDDYLDAWNRQDIDGIRRLLDKRARYYDAFWMEYTSGSDLFKYLINWFEEEDYWYQRHSEVRVADGSYVYRYVARERTPSGPGEQVYNGAEVVSLRDGKIVTISDYYCNPDLDALVEVASLARQHHGETRTAPSGVGARRAMRYRNQLTELFEKEKVFLDSELSQVTLARRLGCTVDQLTQVIADSHGLNFHNLVDGYRVRVAKQLLREGSQNPESLATIAGQSGFASVAELDSAFRRLVGETATQFLELNAGDDASVSQKVHRG